VNLYLDYVEDFSMESITKTKLSYEQIVAITRLEFGKTKDVQEIVELTDGYFNTAYKVVFHDGQIVVLKVSPKNDVVVMRYEHDLMEIEVSVLQKTNELAGVPIPKILYNKQGESLIENDYFFMEFVAGVPLDKLSKQLSEEQNKCISSDLGLIAKKINDINGDYFGAISRPEKQFDNWPDAFLCMIKDLLDDAADTHVVLPFAYDVIYHMVEAHREVLAAVKAPSLVHKDLWQGNIFVDPDTVQIRGIVDFERAVYGDRLLEPVCGFLVENKAFMDAYWGRTELAREENIRVILYKIYLFLIMVIECSYRQYDNDNQEKWARVQLEESFKNLAGYSKI